MKAGQKIFSAVSCLLEISNLMVFNQPSQAHDTGESQYDYESSRYFVRGKRLPIKSDELKSTPLPVYLCPQSFLPPLKSSGVWVTMQEDELGTTNSPILLPGHRDTVPFV